MKVFASTDASERRLRVQHLIQSSSEPPPPSSATWAIERPGNASAVAVIEMLTGVRVQDECSDVPDMSPPETSGEAVKLMHFLVQAGPTIAKYVGAGVPLLELARDRVARLNRHSASRHRQQLKHLQTQDVDQMVATTRQLL